jgi:hypothetical protein
MTATSSSGVVPSRPVTPGDLITVRGDLIGLDSHHGPVDESKGHNSESHHHLQVHDMSEKDHT